jgi:hypothetical protein
LLSGSGLVAVRRVAELDRRLRSRANARPGRPLGAAERLGENLIHDGAKDRMEADPDSQDERQG